MAEVAGHLGDVGRIEDGDHLGIHDHEFIDNEVRDQRAAAQGGRPPARTDGSTGRGDHRRPSNSPAPSLCHPTCAAAGGIRAISEIRG
jgi:hypothetical protein